MKMQALKRLAPLLLLVMGGCGDDLDAADRVSAGDLKAAMEKGLAMALDVRALSDYSALHIKGALSMPLNTIASRLSELPRNKRIVTYCS